MNVTALQPGAKVGGYEVKRLLGAGGFGMTYEGYNPITRNRVAIKELFPKGIVSRQGATIIIGDQRDQQVFQSVLKKFEESTTKLAQLSHPNIVKVFDYIPGNNTGYMMMEYIEGDILAGLLDKMPGRVLPSEAEFARVFAPICDALAYVHANNLLHRDISPDNIMIDRTGRPVLIDFGAFKEMDQTNRASTLMVAREAYAPPEQGVVDDIAHRPYTDVYALGATMYETLAGEPPVKAGKRIFVKADPYVPLGHKAKVPCSALLVAAIDKALRLVAEERPQSIEELTRMMGWDATRVATPRPTSGAVPAQPVDAEAHAWAFVKDKSETRLVRDFLQQFPSGRFAFMARHKLAELGWAQVRATNDPNRIRMFAAEHAGTGPADEATQWLARHAGPPTVQVQPPFAQPGLSGVRPGTAPVPPQPAGLRPPGYAPQIPPVVHPGAYVPPPAHGGGMALVGKLMIGFGVVIGAGAIAYLVLQNIRRPDINTVDVRPTPTNPAPTTPTNTTTPTNPTTPTAPPPRPPQQQTTPTLPATTPNAPQPPRQSTTIPLPDPSEQSKQIATTPPPMAPKPGPNLVLARAPITSGKNIDISNVDDFTACSDLCRQNSTCSSFNYYSATRECRLWGPAAPTPPPTTTPTPPTQQTSIPPGSFRAVGGIETDAACQTLCRNTPGCGTPQYVPDFKECRLWAAGTTPTPLPPKQIATAPTPPPATPPGQRRQAQTGGPEEQQQTNTTVPPAPPPAPPPTPPGNKRPAQTGGPEEQSTTQTTPAPPPTTPRPPQRTAPANPTDKTVSQRIGTLTLTLDAECHQSRQDDGRFVTMRNCSGNRLKDEAFRKLAGTNLDACVRACTSETRCRVTEFEEGQCFLFDSMSDVFNIGEGIAVKR